MPNIFNADNGVVSGSAGIKLSSDTSGVLNIQTNGTTAISISASQVVSFPATSGFSFAGQVTFAAGTAAAPSISVTGDTNTGIYFPAADTIAFTEGGVESMRIDSAGNVGIGTGSPGYRLTVSGGATSLAANQYLRFGAGIFAASDGSADNYLFTGSTALRWRNSADSAELMQLTNSGNLGLGVTPSAWTQGRAFEVLEQGYGVWNGTASAYLLANTYFNSGFKYANSGAAASHYYQFQGAHVWSTAPSGTAGNAISFTQAMTLTAAGNLLVGTTTVATGASITGFPGAGGTVIGTPWADDKYLARMYFDASYFLGIRANGATRALELNANSGDSTARIVFQTGSTGTLTERARITSVGDLLIGTTGSSAALSVVARATYPVASFDSPSAGYAYMALRYSGTPYGYFGQASAMIGGTSNTDLAFRSENALLFASGGGSERARITSNGNLLVATTSDTDNVRFRVDGANSTWGTGAFYNGNKGVNVSHIHYGGNGDWYIRPANASGTVYVLNYAAESDQRLKKDITDIEYGLAEVMNFKPRKFRWKEGDGRLVNGFVAQEVEQIVPSIISEGQWKAVDYNGMTAILVKAIQELKAELDQLKGAQ